MKEILNKASVIDVRSPEEFAQGHYPEALNIPLNQISSRINEIKSLATPIITYCRSGNRSAMANAILAQQGITNVYNGGGLNDLLQLKKLNNADHF